MEDKRKIGRPRRRFDDLRFDMNWDRSLLAKIDERKGERSRRDYIEYLLRTHPEMQDQESYNGEHDTRN